MSSSELITRCGREIVSRADEAAGVSAGRAEKRKEAERAVLAASRRWRKSPHLVPSSGGPGSPSRNALVIWWARARAEALRKKSHRLKASWFGTLRESSRAREENGLDVSGREAGRPRDQGRDGTSRGSVG
jgi:hypothetical protein